MSMDWAFIISQFLQKNTLYFYYPSYYLLYINRININTHDSRGKKACDN